MASRKPSKADRLKALPKKANGGWLDSYEDGGDETKILAVDPEYKEIQNWYGNYISSPKYKKRLEGQGYADPDKTIQYRKEAVDNVTNYGTAFDEYGKPTGSYSDITGNSIYMNKDSNKQLGPNGTIYAHELGHIGGGALDPLGKYSSRYKQAEHTPININDWQSLTRPNKQWQNASWVDSNFDNESNNEAYLEDYTEYKKIRPTNTGDKWSPNYEAPEGYPQEKADLLNNNFNAYESASSAKDTAVDKFFDKPPKGLKKKREFDSKGDYDSYLWDEMEKTPEYQNATKGSKDAYQNFQDTVKNSAHTTDEVVKQGRGYKKGRVHDIGGTEAYGDLQGMRWWAQKNLGFNPEDEMTPEKWGQMMELYKEKGENNLTIERMIRRYGKDGKEAIKIMNTVADTGGDDGLQRAENGGWLDSYEHGGMIPKYENGTEDLIVEDPMAEVNSLTNAGAKNFNDFIIDIDDFDTERLKNIELGKIHDTSGQYLGIDEKTGKHKYGKPGCVAGALNCNQSMVADKLGLDPIRDIMYDKVGNVKDSPFSIPSGPKGSMPEDYAANQSIDAWELADSMVGSGAGTLYYDVADNGTEKGKNLGTLTRYSPKNLDYKNIPLGAMILQNIPGQDNPYVGKEHAGKPRHAATVIGFDKEGFPLMYDFGKITRVDMPLQSIQKIVVPKGYEDKTYAKMKGAYDTREKELGYEGSEDRKYNYTDSNVNNIYKSTDKIAHELGREYSIPKNTMSKLQARVVGIGGQESGLNTKPSMIAENIPGYTSVLKGVGKSILNPFIGESEEGAKADWEVEMEAYEAAGDDKEKFKKEYDRLRDKYPEKKGKYNTEPSVGPFQMKDMPKYATDTLGLKKEELYGANVGNEDEISKGSQAALIHLLDSYKSLSAKYPKLKENELIDLATVAYNNKGKTESKDFIDFYIKNKKLPDDYLSKVKAKEKEYHKTGNVAKLAALKNGGWLDEL